MGELSPWHWAIVILIAVLLFGSRRLPDAARSLGRSARILKAELREGAAPTSSEQPAPHEAPRPELRDGATAVAGPVQPHDAPRDGSTTRPRGPGPHGTPAGNESTSPRHTDLRDGSTSPTAEPLHPEERS